MPIVEKMDPKNNSEIYYAYEAPSYDVLYEHVNHMQNIFDKYLAERGIKEHEASADVKILSQIAVRLDQRCEYFRIYHKNTRLSEMRKIGILAYWIVKYRPFSIETDDGSKWQNQLKVNETVALHMILGMIARIVYGDSNRILTVSNNYCKKILHGFKEQDLSKEAFMIIADSLLENVV